MCRRNRLKVYKGYFALASRDFKQAATLFLDAVSTFTCQELLSYPEFVQLTVFAAMLVLSRPDLKKKVTSCNDAWLIRCSLAFLYFIYIYIFYS
jgi:26S proteasome regulatory subunit N7